MYLSLVGWSQEISISIYYNCTQFGEGLNIGTVPTFNLNLLGTVPQSYKKRKTLRDQYLNQKIFVEKVCMKLTIKAPKLMWVKSVEYKKQYQYPFILPSIYKINEIAPFVNRIICNFIHFHKPFHF